MTDFDPRRLARAVFLDADPLEGRRYMISGGARAHLVDLDGEHGADCDCPDHAIRRVLCKHLGRALLAEGDPGTIVSLRGIVPHPDEARRDP